MACMDGTWISRWKLQRSAHLARCRLALAELQSVPSSGSLDGAHLQRTGEIVDALTTGRPTGPVQHHGAARLE